MITEEERRNDKVIKRARYSQEEKDRRQLILDEVAQ